MGMAVDEGGNEVAKTMTKDLLKTDAQKWKNKRKVKNDQRQKLEVRMVIFSFFLFIERIIFMFSNKLEVKENVSQTFYYYFSGVGGANLLFCIILYIYNWVQN